MEGAAHKNHTSFTCNTLKNYWLLSAHYFKWDAFIKARNKLTQLVSECNPLIVYSKATRTLLVNLS